MTVTSSKFLDIKPEPKTALEVWQFWMNDMSSQFIKLQGKRIIVK